MAVFNKYIFEYLDLRQTPTKNLHTADVVERLSILMGLDSNFKIFQIDERLRFTEDASRLHGIINMDISETLSLDETPTPRLDSPYVVESLSLQEGASGHVVPQGYNWAGDLSPPYQSLSGDIIREVPAGDVDGVNDTFVLTLPVGATSLLTLYVDNILQTEYTLVSDTITFNVGFEPPEGSQLLAYYRS